MTRRLLVALALALVASAASAQTEDAPETHTFQIVDGVVLLDGRVLTNAVPADLDLSGYTMEPLEYSGPIVPVLDVDGVVWVLEGEALVRLDESSRAGQGVYILREDEPDAVALSDLPRDRVRPLVEQAYMNDVAERNRTLYEGMQREQRMESDVALLADQIRALPSGDERARLRDRLRDLLSDLLALKHENRAAEIEEAAARLADARRAHAFREAHHDEIVDGRLRELVGDE